jgi:exosortase/archaeosortase family protein
MGYGGTVRTLNVAEACAGLRSLMTFVSVGAAVAFLSARPLWQKIVITVTSIPIAIFCNVMRVSGQGLLDHYVSQQLSENFAHQFVGMIMLIPAFLLILLVGWVLDQIFLEEVDRKYIAAAPNVIRRSGGQSPLAAVPAPRHSVVQRRGPVIPRTAPVPSSPKITISPRAMTSPRAVPAVPMPPATPKPVAPKRIPPPPTRPSDLPPPPSVRLAHKAKPPAPKNPPPPSQREAI